VIAAIVLNETRQATAARDYQYMTTNLTPCPDIQKIFIPTDVFPEIEIPSKGDLFGKYYELPDAHKESWRLATALSRVFPKSWTYSTHEKALYLMRLPARTFSLPVRIVASTIIALSGGALLIVPMVVMSFNPSRPKSLITVSCAVFLFGFCVGVVLRRKTYNTFLATAAYAAVLVVFVGTGTGSG
jgi:VIT1/CCC1 family predicted Fe2+/Mn2+ transporter